MRRLTQRVEPDSTVPAKKIRALGKSDSGVPWWQTSNDAEQTQSLNDTDITTSSERGRRPKLPPREISPIEERPAPPPPPTLRPVPPPIRPVPPPMRPLPPEEIMPPPELRPVVPPRMRYPMPPEEEEHFPFPMPPVAAPCPDVQEMEMAILRECLIRKIKSIEFYLEMAEIVKGNLCEFFLCKAKDEIEHFKLLLGMLGHLDPDQADELESSDLQDCMVKAMEFCCHRTDMMWGEEQPPEFMDRRRQDDAGESDDVEDDEAETMRMIHRPHRQMPFYFYHRPIEPVPCYREHLARAVKMEADMISFYEEHLCNISNCDIRNLLSCIIMHEKKDLAQFSQQLIKTFPES